MNRDLRVVILAILFLLLSLIYNGAAFGANDSIGNATEVPLGNTTTDVLTSSQNTDYFKFTLPSDGSVDIAFSNVADTGNWIISVIDGSSYRYLYKENYTSFLNNIGLPAGTYYIKVSHYATSTYNKNYQFTVNFTAGDNYEKEFNNSIGSANTISLNTTYTGALQSRDSYYDGYDIDYHKFTLSTAGSVGISFANVADTGNWNISVMDGSANRYLYKGNYTSFSNNIGLPAGTYYIKVSHSATSTFNKSYQLTVNFTAGNNYEKEFNNNIGSANTISLNTTYTGALQSRDLYDDGYDIDYYQFTLSADGNVTLAFSNVSDTGNWNVRVLDGFDHVYLFEENVTNVLGDLALPAGTYYIKVSYNSSSTFSKNYQLTANFASGDNYEKEFNDSIGTANTINLNTSYTGALQSRSDSDGYDNDYYKFTLSTNGNVTIVLSNITDTGNWNVRVMDAAANVFLFAENVTSISKEVALPAGTYYVRVSGYYTSTYDKNYQLAVNFTAGDNYEKEFNDSAGTANTITLNTLYTGNLQNRSSGYDTDYYKFTLASAGNVGIVFKNATDTGGWNVSVLDGSANSFMNKSNITDISQDVALSAGTYYVKVSAYYTSTIGRSYLLTAYEDFPLTVNKIGNGSGTVSATDLTCSGSTCSAFYNKDKSVILTATANSNSSFTGWSGACTGTSDCTVTLNEAKTLSASFTLNTYGMTVNVTGTGSGTVSATGLTCNNKTCTGSYNSGTIVTLTSTASSGSEFTGWSGGGCTGKGACVTTVSSAATITANFSPTYTLTVNKSGSGSVSVNTGPLSWSSTTGTATYSNGTAITLYASAGSGYTFSGWGGDCSGTGTCSLTMSMDKSVTATFTEQGSTGTKYTLTVTKTGGGEVTANTGAMTWSGSSGTATYNSGSQVTLTATDAEGYNFAGWSGDCSGTGTCSVTMTANMTVTATFTQESTTPQYTLTVTKSGNGTVASSLSEIDCGLECETSLDESTVITLTATPDDGYTFIGWSGACKSSSTTCSLTMDADKVVSAAFGNGNVTKSYFIVASAGKGGSIDQKGRIKVSEGMDLTFIVTPIKGYELADVKVDGKSVKEQMESGYYTFSNITGNHKIASTFKQKTIPVAVSAGSHGKIMPAISSMKYGKSQVFTVIPDKGYAIESVSIGGVAQDLMENAVMKPVKFTVKPDESVASLSVTATFRAVKASDYLSGKNIKAGNYNYSVKYCTEGVCVTPASDSSGKYYAVSDLYDLIDDLVDDYGEGTCSLKASNIKVAKNGFICSRSWKCSMGSYMGKGIYMNQNAVYTFKNSQFIQQK